MSFFGLHVHLYNILLWGFLATAVLSAILEGSQKFGLSRIGLPFMLGTIFTPDRRRANVIGFVVHFINGWLFAFFYALIFEDLRMATWWLGALLGVIHGLVILTLGMTLLPLVHPRMADERFGPTATRWLQPPGFLALNYGRRTPLVGLFAHLVYGTILGFSYQLLASVHG